MVRLDTLSNAQVTLLATLLVTQSNLAQLQALAAERRDVLTETILCQLLLTYLPADVDQYASLASFLVQLQRNFEDISELDVVVEISAVENLSLVETERRLHELRFNTIQNQQPADISDPLTSFLIAWIYQLEQTCGISPAVLLLVDSVADTRPYLRQWRDAYLLPLLKLQNDFYPGRADSIDLGVIEDLQGSYGVRTLLQFAEQDREKAQIGRDLDQVVSPWVHGASKAKRRRVDDTSQQQQTTSWQDVNEWIYTTSHTNFSLATRAVIEWDGPADSGSNENELDHEEDGADSSLTPQIRYAQAALALVLSSHVSDSTDPSILEQLLDRATSLTASNPVMNPSKGILAESSRADLLDNALLRPQNPLTIPSDEALTYLHACLSDQKILQNFRLSMTVSSIAETALFGSEEKQKQELNRVLSQIPRMTKSDTDWTEVRDKLHSLHSGQIRSASEDASGRIHFLGRISNEHLEVELLDAILNAGQYSVVKDIYISNTQPPLVSDHVQNRVISAIFVAYDNASNGNRTRGGVRKAAELLKAFQSSFENTEELSRIEYLIKATHSLSFYQLTLQHGVPFQPVNIRVHRDPLTLIENVLRQNHKAYTKLDDLIEIGCNLVRAGLPEEPEAVHENKTLDEKLFDATHRVTYLAITAALADNDFDTAYSYITTRLSMNTSQNSSSSFTDDTSWRAAYEAGKHRPSNSPKNIHDRIASLSKRMDLLALALTLAPKADVLPEILSTWCRCEKEMDNLKSHAVKEERAFEAHGDDAIPGGFGAGDRELDAADTRRLLEKRAINSTSPTYEEEAPMGLFDVARGAASAIRKSAFPLRGAGSDNFKLRQAVVPESPRSDMEEFHDSQQRVRKRDMVSNMVTGGLVSGMSWVLGTPAATSGKDEHDER